MDQSVSSATSKSKSAPAESKTAPAPELDHSKPIECDGVNTPIPIGNDRQSGVRCRPVSGRFKAGTIEGLVDRIRLLPNGCTELRIVQQVHSHGRTPKDVCFAIITPSGMVLEASTEASS